MREQPRAGGDAGAELPVPIPICVSLPGDGAGSTIHKLLSGIEEELPSAG